MNNQMSTKNIHLYSVASVMTLPPGLLQRLYDARLDYIQYYSYRIHTFAGAIVVRNEAPRNPLYVV